MEKQAHIQLDESVKLTKAIIVGDPARVGKVAEQLESPKELTFNREYRSVTGTYRGVPILVISTGIGAPSTAIAVEELTNIGIKEIIRVGSCGAMQPGIQLGELVVATGAVRDEGLTSKYVPATYPAIPDSVFLERAQQLLPTAHFGIVRSHDGFYMDENAATERFWSQYGVLGADMETSCLFIVGSLRGLKTASILNNVVLYEADLSEGVNDLVSGEDRLAQGELESIRLALEILTKGAE